MIPIVQNSNLYTIIENKHIIQGKCEFGEYMFVLLIFINLIF